MDDEKLKNFDGAILSLLTSAELWIAVGAVGLLFVVMYIKRVLDARSQRLFGRQRFNSQNDLSKGQVFWFGNAIGADPWVLVDVTNDYLKFEDRSRVRHIPTKNFPDIEWTISKDLSSANVLDGSYKIKIVDAESVNLLIDKLDKFDEKVGQVILTTIDKIDVSEDINSHVQDSISGD